MFENMDGDGEILAEFITESMENLDDLDTQLLTLEKDPGDKDVLNHVFRAIHTVKGGSGFLSVDEITTLSHKLENVLDDLRNDVLVCTPGILDVLLEGIDTLKKLMDILQEECEEPGSTKDTVFDLQPVLDKIEKIKDDKPPESGETEAASSEAPAPESDTTDEDEAFQNIIEENKKTFVEETKEYVGTIDNELIKLEKGDDVLEITEQVFRIVHNIKGNSAYLGFAKMEQLTHNFENILDELRKGNIKISPEICKLLFKTFDKFKALFEVVVNEGNDSGDEDIDGIVQEINTVLAGNISAPAETAVADESGLDQETKDIFVKNAEIHLATINNSIDQIKSGDKNEMTMDNLLRGFSSLTNAANYVNSSDLKRLMESNVNLATIIKAANKDITEEVIDVFVKSSANALQMVNAVETGGAGALDSSIIDALNKLCAEIKTKPAETAAKTAPPAAPVVPAKPPVESKKPEPPKKEEPKAKDAGGDKKKDKKGKVEQTIRVEHSKLDILMNLIGELIISRNQLDMLSEKIGTNYNLPEISKELNRASVSLGKISDDLQESIMSVRMIPVGTVFNKFPRVVRDLAKTKEKSIELNISGEETNLDKTIIEQIGDPLVHLIRNGVDHGVESPEDRKLANKPPTGTIDLRAYQKADNVIIEIEDNGKGMDPNVIRDKAVEKGIIDKEDADKLTSIEALNLIFEAGFSTAEKITDISGRGVGMDVVRNNIRKLGGHVYITSEKGVGSKFTLTLPLTLAIIRAIMIKLGDSTFAIPLNTIVETVKVPKEQIKTMKNKKVINLRGEVIGIVDLVALMEIPVNGRDEDCNLVPIVIMATESKKIGFVVDDLLKQQEIVIKPLVDFLSIIPGLSGATILGDGKIVLIIDPAEIVELATSSENTEITAA